MTCELHRKKTYIVLSAARPVHVSHLARLQELDTGQLLVLVCARASCLCARAPSPVKVFTQPVTPPQVCYRGVRGPGHTAEGPQDPRDVPKRHEEVQPGFAQGWPKQPSSVLPLPFANSVSRLQGDKSVRVMRSLLATQQTFVDRLVQLMKAVQRESGNRKKKVVGGGNLWPYLGNDTVML